ncbi:MAG: EAL domain-containing protein [Pseudomonadota bacterium]
MPRHNFEESGQEDPLTFATRERDRHILQVVRGALSTNNCTLAFQPVFSAVSGEVAFHEAFIRILDSTGRIIPAAQFMPVTELDELGRVIDSTALRLGMKTLAEQPNLRLSINMSARSIGYPPWIRVLKRWLREDATIGERLILEINEASAMQVPELVKVFMTELQDAGITFALDDFGADMTSFGHLKQLYFDVMKIDADFVRDCDTDPNNQCMLGALIALAQELDMFTVAEAVETQAEADFLTRLGIDCMQGYAFASPSAELRTKEVEERKMTG